MTQLGGGLPGLNDAVLRRAEPEEPGMLSKVLGGIATVFGPIEKYVDAPTRALLGNIVGVEGTGQDTIFGKAPSGRELLGIGPGTKGKFESGDVAGFAVEALASPINLLGVGELTKAGKAAKALTGARRTIKALEAFPERAGQVERLLAARRALALAEKAGAQELAPNLMRQGLAGQRSFLSLSPPLTGINVPLMPRALSGAAMAPFTGLGVMARGAPGYERLANLMRVGERMGPGTVSRGPEKFDRALYNDLRSLREEIIRGSKLEGEEAAGFLRSELSKLDPEAARRALAALPGAISEPGQNALAADREAIRLRGIIERGRASPTVLDAAAKRLADMETKYGVLPFLDRMSGTQAPDTTQAFIAAIGPGNAVEKLRKAQEAVQKTGADRLAALDRQIEQANKIGDAFGAQKLAQERDALVPAIAAHVNDLAAKERLSQTIWDAMPQDVRDLVGKVNVMHGRELALEQLYGGKIDELRDLALGYQHRAITPQGQRLIEELTQHGLIDDPRFRYISMMRPVEGVARRRTRQWEGMSELLINDKVQELADAARAEGYKLSFGANPTDRFFGEDPADALLRRIQGGGKLKGDAGFLSSVASAFRVSGKLKKADDMPIAEFLHRARLGAIDTGALPAVSKKPWEMTLQEFDERYAGKWKPGILTDDKKFITGTDHGDALNRAADAGHPVDPTKLGQRSGWEVAGRVVLDRDFPEGSPDLLHLAIVRQAISEGKTVPPEVLADYPKLWSKSGGLTKLPPRKPVSPAAITGPGVPTVLGSNPIKIANQLKGTPLEGTYVVGEFARQALKMPEQIKQGDFSKFLDKYNSMMRYWVTSAGFKVPTGMGGALIGGGAGAIAGGITGGVPGALIGGTLGAGFGQMGSLPFFPQFDIRNNISNAFAAWLGGMHNPAGVFKAMTDIQLARRAIANPSGATAAEKAALESLRSPTALGALSTTLAGETTELIEQAGHVQGLRINPTDTKLKAMLRGAGRQVFDPSATKAGQAAIQRSSDLENAWKLAMYRDGINKGMSTSDAAERVRKFLFDYSQLGPLDKKIRQYAFFWTYMRKAVPLIAEQIFTNPAKMRLYAMLSGNAGPSDQQKLLTDYQRAQDMVNIGRDEQGRQMFMSLGLTPDPLQTFNAEGKPGWSGVARVAQKVAANLAPPYRFLSDTITGTELRSGQPTNFRRALWGVTPMARGTNVVNRILDTVGGTREPSELGQMAFGTPLRVNPRAGPLKQLANRLDNEIANMAMMGKARKSPGYGDIPGQYNLRLHALLSTRQRLTERIKKLEPKRQREVVPE